jgi:hypothetical protein
MREGRLTNSRSTCAYVHQLFPAILDRNKTGLVYDAALGYGYTGAVLTRVGVRQHHRHLLEVRADRGAAEPLHELVLRLHGGKDAP